MTDNSRRTLSNWFEASSSEEALHLQKLTTRLAEEDRQADLDLEWPTRMWEILVAEGGNRWALPEEQGGIASDRSGLIRRYAAVAEGSLTLAFILTQHDAAIRRLALASGEGKETAESILGEIKGGNVFPTVGISQLTTSRRSGPQAMIAEEVAGGFRLTGTMPWVTAASRADIFVTGAVLADGRQMLAVVPRDREGLTVCPPYKLAALGSSQTCEVQCKDVFLSRKEVLAGPAKDVMATPGLAGTGGLETSTLALGLARAALVALSEEGPGLSDLADATESFAANWKTLADRLLAAAEGRSDASAPAQIRAEANLLVLRLTQAYLTARRGSGFITGEKAERWARQALFFLVWSCPSPIANAAIRDFAGLCDL